MYVGTILSWTNVGRRLGVGREAIWPALVFPKWQRRREEKYSMILMVLVLEILYMAIYFPVSSGKTVRWLRLLMFLSHRRENFFERNRGASKRGVC